MLKVKLKNLILSKCKCLSDIVLAGVCVVSCVCFMPLHIEQKG